MFNCMERDKEGIWSNHMFSPVSFPLYFGVHKHTMAYFRKFIARQIKITVLFLFILTF